jgi:hypothetical protein
MQLFWMIDYQGLIEKSPLLRKYDAIFMAFNRVFTQRDHPTCGRKGYARSAYLKALIYKQGEQIKYMTDLVRDLHNRPTIAMMCGFTPGRIPDASRFSRFLSKTKNSQVEEMLHKTVDLLREAGHVSLDVVIGDSKPIRANSKHNNPKNPSRSLDKTKKIKRNRSATLGYYSYLKQPVNGKQKQHAFFWGYRTHVLVSKEGVVLTEVTRPNNIADADVAKTLLRKLKRRYGQNKGRKIILDAAYDTNEIYNFIVTQMKAEPFIGLNRRRTSAKNTDGSGTPICQADFKMLFNGMTTDRNRSRKKFVCPIKHGSKAKRAAFPAECPVNHPRFTEGKCYGCTAYIDPKGQARARVARQSKRFKDIYSRRTVVERYFARLGPREFEDVTITNYRSVRNLMTIAHLTNNLVAVAAAIIIDRPDKMRCYKTFADTSNLARAS